MNYPQEPTGDQCNAQDRMPDFEETPAYACWYPQMGGYVGRCVVVVNQDVNSCFEAYIWHDGDFPFFGEGHRTPVHIHHCDPEQFIIFGKQVRSWQGTPDEEKT